MANLNYLEEDDLRLVLKVTLLPTPRAIAIYLCAASGARQQEILNLSLKDIDEENGTIFIRGLKGSNDRIVGVKKDAMQILLSQLRRHPGKDLGQLCGEARSLSRYWTNLFQELFPKKKHVSLHGLRHTLALILLKESEDIRAVKQIMGHKSIQSTFVYVDHLETRGLDNKRQEILDRIAKAS